MPPTSPTDRAGVRPLLPVSRRSRRGPLRSLPTGWHGFTLVELLIGLVLAGVVMTAVYGLMVSQFRTYSTVREKADVHTSLRAAGALLAWELRMASASDGDLYALAANSTTLRSFVGTGVICSKDPSQPRYGLVGVDGELAGDAADSVLVFAAGSVGSGDDEWKPLELVAVGAPSGGVSSCAWAGRSAEVELQVAAPAPGDTAGIAVGAPVRAFRPVQYGLFTWEGRSWLGRNVAGSWEAITGPLRADDGVQFAYYDGAGNVTADPVQVAAVRVALRAESDRRAGPDEGFESDSLTLRVALRN